MLCDLLWADPDTKILNWGENERNLRREVFNDLVHFLLMWVNKLLRGPLIVSNKASELRNPLLLSES